MIYNAHTHQYINDGSIQIINRYPEQNRLENQFFSIGIHPWYVTENWENDLSIVWNEAKQNNCLAIGEIGIDKRATTDFDLQLKIFEQQLVIAQQLNKPVILHIVAAFDQLIALKKKHQIQQPMIIHGFSKNAHLAASLISHGFYLSFGKHFLKSKNTEEAFIQTPKDRILLETDNSDIDIHSIYNHAKTLSTENIEQQIEQNFKTIFNTNSKK